MLVKLNNLGRLVDKDSNRIDYKSKKQPLVSICERGDGMEQLFIPIDIKVDSIQKK